MVPQVPHMVPRGIDGLSVPVLAPREGLRGGLRSYTAYDDGGKRDRCRKVNQKHCFQKKNPESRACRMRSDRSLTSLLLSHVEYYTERSWINHCFWNSRAAGPTLPASRTMLSINMSGGSSTNHKRMNVSLSLSL